MSSLRSRNSLRSFNTRKLWPIGSGNMVYFGDPGDVLNGYVVAQLPGGLFPICKAHKELLDALVEALNRGEIHASSLMGGTRDLKGRVPH